MQRASVEDGTDQEVIDTSDEEEHDLGIANVEAIENLLSSETLKYDGIYSTLSSLEHTSLITRENMANNHRGSRQSRCSDRKWKLQGTSQSTGETRKNS